MKPVWKREPLECPLDIHKPATRSAFFNGCLMDTIKVQNPELISRILLVVLSDEKFGPFGFCFVVCFVHLGRAPWPLSFANFLLPFPLLFSILSRPGFLESTAQFPFIDHFPPLVPLALVLFPLLLLLLDFFIDLPSSTLKNCDVRLFERIQLQTALHPNHTRVFVMDPPRQHWNHEEEGSLALFFFGGVIAISSTIP